MNGTTWFTVLTITIILLLAMGAAALLSEYLEPTHTIGAAWTEAPR